MLSVSGHTAMRRATSRPRLVMAKVEKPRLVGSPDDCLGPGEGWDEVLPFIDTPEKATALYILISTTYHIDAKGRFAELIVKCRALPS